MPACIVSMMPCNMAHKTGCICTLCHLYGMHRPVIEHLSLHAHFVRHPGGSCCPASRRTCAAKKQTYSPTPAASRSSLVLRNIERAVSKLNCASVSATKYWSVSTFSSHVAAGAAEARACTATAFALNKPFPPPLSPPTLLDSAVA